MRERREFLEQDVQPLRFGNHYGRAQQGADILGHGARKALEQILGEQDTDDFIVVLAMHGETRMTRLGDATQDFIKRGIDRQGHHLGARNHRIGDVRVGYFDGAFDHRQSVVGEQAVDLGAAQFFEQLVDVAGFARDELADAFQPRS